MLVLNAIGRLTLTDESGEDFSPNGSKARAVLVLLAVSPKCTRSRVWLQSKLWSDRAPVQAAASLRMALSEIRRSLGLHRHLLTANRSQVSLTPQTFVVNYAPPNGAEISTQVEPFEDVDARDPEFEHLIRDLRQNISNEYIKTSVVKEKRNHHIVILRCESRGGPSAIVAGRVLRLRIQTALLEIDDLEIVLVGGDDELPLAQNRERQPTQLFSVNVLAVSLADQIFLSCEICACRNDQLLWSDNVTLPGNIGDIQNSVGLDRLALHAAEKAFDAFYKNEPTVGTSDCAFVLARTATALFFKLDKKSLVDSDRLFMRAFEIEPRGRYLAWRGFIRNAAFFQHRTTSLFDGEESAIQFAVEALRLSPNDAVVGSLSSQVEYVHQGNLRMSHSMAQRGVSNDPTNPLCWAMFSNASTTNGRLAEGYASALRALQLARGKDCQFYFEHFACMAAAALKDYDQALIHAQAALYTRPEFVSARRYEIALCIERSDFAGLSRSISALALQEPDFRPSLFLDPSYPVSTLRRLPLIEAIR